jgi:hypothetical protein
MRLRLLDGGGADDRMLGSVAHTRHTLSLSLAPRTRSQARTLPHPHTLPPRPPPPPFRRRQNNNCGCGWDAGDCCNTLKKDAFSRCKTCKCLDPDIQAKQLKPKTPGNCLAACGQSKWVQDAYCDDNNNNCGCGWDGGDCCGPFTDSSYCTECLCHDPDSIYAGMSCGTSCAAVAKQGDGCVLEYTRFCSVLRFADKYCAVVREKVPRGKHRAKSTYVCGTKKQHNVNIALTQRCPKVHMNRTRTYSRSRGVYSCATKYVPPEHCRYCDDGNNVCGCDWDGGDCCLAGKLLQTKFCTVCACLDPADDASKTAVKGRA